MEVKQHRVGGDIKQRFINDYRGYKPSNVEQLLRPEVCSGVTSPELVTNIHLMLHLQIISNEGMKNLKFKMTSGSEVSANQIVSFPPCFLHDARVPKTLALVVDLFFHKGFIHTYVSHI